MLVVRPAPRNTGRPFRKGWPFPPTSSNSGKAENPRHQTCNRFWGCCRSTSSVNESPGRERLVAYQFVTNCANCAKQFGILWVMDSTRQAGPKTVAWIACPICGTRFYQDAKDLRQIGSQIEYLIVGRPVRNVEVDYDCAHCGNRGILVSLLHTDLSWDELYLSEEHVQTAVCDNGLCPQRGLLQKLKPSRVVLGSLNPVLT